MPNPYDVDTRETNLMGPMARLKIIYDEMPATSGCEKCAENNGEGQKDWCCHLQNPSMYYIEFLYVWKEVQKWSKARKVDLILRAIRNYLSNSLSKGCVFYYPGNGCQIYDRRPYICRMYGVICPEHWDKRWTELKERQKERFEAKPQCPLVKVADPDYPSSHILADDENQWFKQIVTCEKRIGVQPHILRLHDEPGGPYRTFHDHLLIELFAPKFLEMLTKARLSEPSAEDIDKTIEFLEKMLYEQDIIR